MYSVRVVVRTTTKSTPVAVTAARPASNTSRTVHRVAGKSKPRGVQRNTGARQYRGLTLATKMHDESWRLKTLKVEWTSVDECSKLYLGNSVRGDVP